MLLKNLYLCACLASPAIASPASGSQLSPRVVSTTYVATFDDRSPVDIVSGILNAPELGSYNGLRWQGFYTEQPGVMGFLHLGSLLPKSGLNTAGYDTLGSLDTNTPTIVRKITVESRSFLKPATLDLQSFWWGCSLGLKQYVLTAPTGCNLTIIGSYAFQEKTRTTVRFQPILVDLVAELKPVVLGDQFKGLDTVTFITDYDIGINGATTFDDFTYTINR